MTTWFQHSIVKTDYGTPQDEQPSSEPWNPEQSLAFLETALNVKPDQSSKKEMETVNEPTDYYVVVYKQEATVQDGKHQICTY